MSRESGSSSEARWKGKDSRWQARPTDDSALDAVAEDRPDLVVLDMTLPRLDGEQVANEIRRLHGDIPLLLITAASRPQEKAERMGAFAFLAKPFDVGELLTLVQGRLQS